MKDAFSDLSCILSTKSKYGCAPNWDYLTIGIYLFVNIRQHANTNMFRGEGCTSNTFKISHCLTFN